MDVEEDRARVSTRRVGVQRAVEAAVPEGDVLAVVLELYGLEPARLGPELDALDQDAVRVDDAATVDDASAF